MKLMEYMTREPTGRAFIEVVMYLNAKDKKKYMPDKTALRRAQYAAITKYGGDTRGLEEIAGTCGKEDGKDELDISVQQGAGKALRSR